MINDIRIVTLGERLLQKLYTVHRSEKKAAQYAESYVGIMLSDLSGEVWPHPPLGGKHPDYLWDVAPKKASFYKFFIEVLWGKDTEHTIEKICEKGRRYSPHLGQYQHLVVAVVYEPRNVDLDALVRHNASKVSIHMEIGMNTLETSEQIIGEPGPFEESGVSAIWMIPVPDVNDVVPYKDVARTHILDTSSHGGAHFSLCLATGHPHVTLPQASGVR